MNTVLVLFISLVFSSYAFASGYKIQLKSGRTLMTVTVVHTLDGAAGNYLVLKETNGSTNLLSKDFIVSGKMQFEANQFYQSPSSLSYFSFKTHKNGRIDITYLQGNQCKLSTSNIIGFNMLNHFLPCSIQLL